VISLKELKTIHRLRVINKLSKLLLFLLVTLFTIAKVNAQEVFLPHYTTKNGLPSNNCYYTLQDKKGFIWIATDAGVSRFDGSVFENFSVDDGLPDNQILQIREDSKGRIWFMALNGQLSYFFNGKIENEKSNPTLKTLKLNGVVVSFLEDSQGKLWFATNVNTIAVWDGKTTNKIMPNNGLKLQNSYLFEDENKNIHAVNNFGNYILNNKTVVIAPTRISTLSYKTMLKTDGQIYFLNDSGLNILENGQSMVAYPINGSFLQNLGYIHVSNQNLWICNNNGATQFSNGGLSKTYLEKVNVSQVVTDKNGNTWFTTTNGIYKLPNASDQLNIFKPKDKPNSYYKSIAKDGLGRLWLGDNTGVITILNLQKGEQTKLSLPSSFNTIKQINLDSKNSRMYFASDYGLGVVNSDYPASKNFNFLRESDDKFFVVKNFSIDTTNKIALSLTSGVVIISNRNKLEFSSSNLKDRHDFFKDRSYRVYYDQQQNLWFSNVAGLNEFDKGKLNKHFQSYSILSKRINDMAQLSDGSIALATDGYGLAYLKDGKIVRIIDHKKGLSNNIVHRLFLRGRDLWAITNNGIDRIHLDTKNIIIDNFDDVNGLLTSDLNDLYIDKDIAYFATNNGLIYFNHTLSRQDTTAPRIQITSIINNGNSLPLDKKSYTLHPKNQALTINYSAIDFKHRNITYRYRLEGDGNWIETKNRRIEFSNLEPGEYTFEISAKSQNSNWSHPSKIALKLERYFYQKWWFLTLTAFAIGYLIYIIGVSITKRQKNKEQEQLLLRNKILMLEQQALQAMMNPHFVFNVMNSIQHFINTQNTSSANKVLTGFARLIRKNLEICTQSYISLDEEINYLNLYLTLEKNRFGDKLKFEINVADEIDKEETLVPSMLLQPFIENSIWHGIMPLETGGKVTLDIAKDNDNLEIKITDDGVGIDNSLASKQSEHQSKGLALTKERIALLNKIEAKSIQLHIKQNGKRGTIVQISLPTQP
jgi:ligand-binding sensor domain-containing protein